MRALLNPEDRSAADAPQSPTAPARALAPGGSVVRAVAAVAASFFGVRGRKGHEADLAQLRPLQLVLTGLLMAAVFVLSLLGLVSLVLRG